jgi:restriction endonuclease
MKLQFDPKQEYQLDAVQAAVDLFEGQPLEKSDYSVVLQRSQDSNGELFAGQVQTENGTGNALLLNEGSLLENLQTVQERNLLDVRDSLDAWTWTDEGGSHWCPHYSVEMETGTGKTYVYLRTIYELNRKYGFKKFIIVVPSVPVREGVLKNLEITRDHFRDLYNNVESEHTVYDSKRVSQLRQFATSNTVQILVINIDAFRKNFTGTEAEKKSNVIYTERDGLNGMRPIEFIRATRPIVILDEPQSVDNTEKAQQAIQALNPLCTLRYSATHKNLYNQIYSLDPIRAYELRLVKQIVVASVTSENSHNEAFVRLVKVDNKNGIKAQIEIDVEQAEGVKRKKVMVKNGDDIHYKSGERSLYATGYQIAEINAEPGNEFILLSNGRRLTLGQEIGRGLRLPVNQDGERVFDETINKLVIVANESYEDFAKSLQTEYEDDCGVTFGKVPMLAFVKLERLEGDKTVTLGRTGSEAIWKALQEKGFVDGSGRIQKSFDPKAPGFDLQLPEPCLELQAEVIDILSSYQLERHIQRDEPGKKLLFKKAVALDDEFQNLWNKIKPRTTYAVEYATETLVQNAAREIRKMERIEPVRLSYRETGVEVERSGLSGTVLREGARNESYRGALPDILAYLQGETELTRGTLVHILKESGRLGEFMVNPQKFMDAVAAILRHELNRLIIDGIKYERIEGEEFEMRLFETDEIIGYLRNRLEVSKSVYDAVVYDSEVERQFAEKLDQREDIKLFVKLPWWFRIETPIGDYNPDWAIVKHDSTALYLVRETKGTKDFEKLRNSETDKIRCGRRHFEALDVNFAVVTSASDV